MKKIINFFKKHDNSVAIIIFSLCILGYVLGEGFEISGDKVWNFANIYKMSVGYKIYNQINIIVTPLFFIIGKILFLIFEKNYLIFKLYGLIIFVLTIFIIYLILKELGANKKLAMIEAIFMIYIIKEIIYQGANYNILAITFCLLGIWLEIKDNEELFNKILQGVVIFLIFLTKQNVAILYLIGLVSAKIIKEKNLKSIIKELIIPALTSFILLILFIGYLIIDKNLNNFLNYCVLGINEFGLKNFVINYTYLISYFGISTIYIIFICNKKIFENKEKLKKIVITFFCFGIPLLLVAFPLLNQYHYYLGLIVISVGIIAIINEMFLNEIINNKLKIISLIIVITIFMVFSAYKSINYLKSINNKEYNLEYNNPLYGMQASKDKLKQVYKISKIVNKNSAIVFSHYANIFNVINNTCYGYMDLPFFGNFGKDGENGVLEKLKSLNNTYILILDTEKEELFWQESEKANNYIKENYEFVENIDKFLLYKTKD